MECKDCEKWFWADSGEEVVKLFEICLTSVSYTHLRAHETVLDLVCRLLLEKKKETLIQCSVPTNNNTTLQVESNDKTC